MVSEPTQIHGAEQDTGAASVGVDPNLGRTLGGRYRLVDRLAKGGMAWVYRATQLTLGREVAVKVLRPQADGAANGAVGRRFLREARAAARLQHPHSVAVLDYGCEPDGTFYLVMEYLKGRPLRQLLRAHGALPPLRAVTVALQVARAVQAAHAQGTVHRDLTPANLLVLQWGEDAAKVGEDFIKVVDFGLAKHFGAQNAPITRAGQSLGSPGYMAPEQILGHAIDGRCDIYALGAVLFEMLGGTAPFAGRTPHETMRAHVAEPVPRLWDDVRGEVTVLAAADVGDASSLRADQTGRFPQDARLRAAAAWPSVRAALQSLVQRALQKDPQHRFASMGAMLDALHAVRRALLTDGAAAVAAADAALALATMQQAQQPAGHDPAAGSAQTVVHSGDGARHWTYGPAQLELTQLAAPEVFCPPADETVMLADVLVAPSPQLGDPTKPHKRTRPKLPFDGRRQLGRMAALAGATAAFAWLTGAAHTRAIAPVLQYVAQTAADAAARPTIFELDSAPRGAGVYMGEECVCLATPCALTLPACSAGTRLQFRFALAEHDDYLLSRVVPATSQDAAVGRMLVFAKLR